MSAVYTFIVGVMALLLGVAVMSAVVTAGFGVLFLAAVFVSWIGSAFDKDVPPGDAFFIGALLILILLIAPYIGADVLAALGAR